MLLLDELVNEFRERSVFSGMAVAAVRIGRDEILFMKFTMSFSSMLNDAIDAPPFKMIFIAASTGAVFQIRETSSSRFP